MTRFAEFTDKELIAVGIALTMVSWQEYPESMPLVAELVEEITSREMTSE